jgi:hypothetical protein
LKKYFLNYYEEQGQQTGKQITAVIDFGAIANVYLHHVQIEGDWLSRRIDIPA